jgi:Uma2 family endonuclease
MVVVTTLPWSRPLTVADLETMPDDGHRYELLDGTLVVSPAPVPLHQVVVLRVARALQDAQPAHLQTFIAPLDVVLAHDTVLQPDVLVARRSDLTDRNLPAPPVLAVEVLSPSTSRVDRFLKHSRYAAAGVTHYWIIDPEEPSLVAYVLVESGTYEEIARVVGAETYEAIAPFAVDITPADLVADV